MIKFHRSFGVHGNLKSEIKIWGPIFLTEFFVFAIVGGLISVGSGFFENCVSSIPHVIFNICTICLGVYSVLRTSSNPGKRNFELFFLSFSHSIRFFKSLNVTDYMPVTMPFDLESDHVKRMKIGHHYQKQNDTYGQTIGGANDVNKTF